MLSSSEIISKLKPCHYRYNKLKNLGEKINYGFLAQDLKEAFGEEFNFVEESSDDEFMKVNYYQFIAPIVSVLKDQQEEINTLKKELKNIKDQA